MEFIICNKPFEGCKKISDRIYISGEYKESADTLVMMDGFIMDDTIWDDISDIGSKKYIGAYNIIKINKILGTIEVMSDKRTVVPIYLYHYGSHFGLSNNPWLLANVFKDSITLNEDSLISQLVYCVDINPDRTLIQNMSRIKAGDSVTYFSDSNKISIDSKYEFSYRPFQNISLEDELAIADEQFTRYFTYIKNHNPGKVAGFGCSGGLDSRLIAHYTNKVGIDTKYYVIGDPRPNTFFKSVTSVVSQKVAKYYNHEIKEIPYRISWLEKSLLLDIRNHPFFFAQIFLNPIEDLPDFDYQLVGDPGGYAYLDSSVISNDVDLLKKHTDFFIGMRKDALFGNIDTFRKMAKHLGIRINRYDENGRYGLKNSLIDKNISSAFLNRARKECYDIIENIPGDNNVEKWIYIHDNITTRYQYAAAYGSMNRTKKSFQLYYPFFYEQIKRFPLSYLENKDFLKKLLLYINPGYKNIPDQNLNYINRKSNVISNIYNRVELAARGRGLQILDLMKSSKYQTFYKDIYLSPNPIFENYIHPDVILNSKLPFTYAGSQYLKLKMVCDLIYCKDFDRLINQPQFEIK